MRGRARRIEEMSTRVSVGNLMIAVFSKVVIFVLRRCGKTWISPVRIG